MQRKCLWVTGESGGWENPHQRSLECGTCWNIVPSLLWPLFPALSDPLNLHVTPHPHFPFSVPHDQALSSLDVVFFVPSAQEAQNLLRWSICIKQVLAEKSRSPSLGCSSLTPALEYPLICFLLSQSALLKVFFRNSPRSTSYKLSYLCIYISVCYLSSQEGALSLLATTVTQ